MTNREKTMARWYVSESWLKRGLSLFISHILSLLFKFKINIQDANKRIKAMKKLGLIKHPVFVFFDMLFCYLFFGYDPSTYASYCFQNVPFKRRITFIPPFENILFAHSLNLQGDTEILANKNSTYELLKEFYGRDQIVIKVKDDYDTFCDFTEKHPKFFYKPLNGALGKNTGLANVNEIDKETFFNSLINIDAFVLEEYIVQCKELSAIHPSSVNSIRLNVIKAKNGTELLCGCFKCGQGGNIVDNGSAGGIFTPFDLNTGRLFKTGFDENGKRFTKHPDTNILFENFQLPRYDEVKSLAIKATDKLPGLRYVGWDIAITEDKVILIEGNGMPGIQISEGLSEIGFKKGLRKLARTGIIPDCFRTKQN